MTKLVPASCEKGRVLWIGGLECLAQGLGITFLCQDVQCRGATHLCCFVLASCSLNSTFFFLGVCVRVCVRARVCVRVSLLTRVLRSINSAPVLSLTDSLSLTLRLALCSAQCWFGLLLLFWGGFFPLVKKRVAVANAHFAT